MYDHRLIDERSLAFGRAIAALLPGHPEHIELAKRNVERWLKTCSPGSRSTLQEWAILLDGPTEGVIGLLTNVDEKSTMLRQSNPFAGVLPEKDRRSILRQFQSYDAATT